MEMTVARIYSTILNLSLEAAGKPTRAITLVPVPVILAALPRVDMGLTRGAVVEVLVVVVVVVKSGRTTIRSIWRIMMYWD